MLAVVYSQPLVLPANEYGTDDVSDYKDSEEDVVEPVMTPRIEDTQEDETCSTGNSGNKCATGIYFLPD